MTFCRLTRAVTERIAVRLCLLLAFGCCAAEAQTVVTGQTIGCVAGKVAQLPDITIYVFDAAANPKLVDLLKELDPSAAQKDDASVAKATARYAELLELVKTTKRLGRFKSDRLGSFRNEVKKADKLVVFAYSEKDTKPLFSYAQLPAAGQAMVSVIFDFSRYDPCGQ